jgi:hypothetical protein
MTGPPVTLGARLERDRLQDRAARLDRVVTVLRARAYEYGDGAAPTPLKHSLADFQRELAAVRQQLRTPTGEPS